MTTKQADKLIKAAQSVTVRNTIANETFTAVFVARSRVLIYTADNGAFHRADLEVVK